MALQLHALSSMDVATSTHTTVNGIAEELEMTM